MVDTNPLGYDMIVGERGDNLSGGQKTVNRNSKSICKGKVLLFMLDEPKSSMD